MSAKARKAPIKAGTSKATAEARRRIFVETYLTNGHNGTQAAIAAGFSVKGASVTGSKLLAEPKVAALIAERAVKVSNIAEMNTENWAKEVAALAFSKLGELYDAGGNLIPLHLLPQHVQAAISSVKIGDNGPEYKFWDKNSALTTMGKHLGLFEKDNMQKGDDIRVLVQLVG